MTENDRISVFSDDDQAARILEAARKVLAADDVQCGVDVALSGDGVGNQTVQINGVEAADANQEAVDELLAAARRVDDAAREAAASKYTDPKSNPMIKLGDG